MGLHVFPIPIPPFMYLLYLKVWDVLIHCLQILEDKGLNCLFAPEFPVPNEVPSTW